MLLRVSPVGVSKASILWVKGKVFGGRIFLRGSLVFKLVFYWDGQQQTLPLGKGKGVQFLQRELGLDPAGVVVAGDADNDLQMFETGYKGILPVNAWEELKTAACAPWHYLNHLLAARGFSTG